MNDRPGLPVWRSCCVFLLLCGLGTLFVACGSTSSSSSSDDSGTETGSTGNNGDSGSDSGDSDTGSGFRITGTVTTTVVGSSISAKGLSSGTITHVMAVSPGTADAGCKSGEVNSSDGTFSFRLTSGRPWFIYFIDRLKQGAEMFKGRLKSSTLDTFAPASETGSLALGSVTIDPTAETAISEKGNSEIVSGLGIDSDTASAVGEIDDVARRYANPDVDSDGSVDCSSSNTQPYMLDFHVRFDILKSGTAVTVTDMVNAYWGTGTTTTTYLNTGVYVVYPTSFASESTGSVTFVDSTVKTDEGGTIAAGTATSSVTNNDFGSNHSFGPNISQTSELPSGTLKFAVGSKTLTFDDVTTPTLAQLNAPTGRIFIFLKINTNDTSCTSHCTIDSIDYKWMKKTSTGWTAATTSELSYLVDPDGGFLSVRVDNSASKTIGITIPKSSTSGNIDWTAANATLTGVTSTEFTNLVTTQLCHIGLSYDDKLGMRYFEGIKNATGTCN